MLSFRIYIFCSTKYEECKIIHKENKWNKHTEKNINNVNNKLNNSLNTLEKSWKKMIPMVFSQKWV